MLCYVDLLQLALKTPKVSLTSVHEEVSALLHIVNYSTPTNPDPYCKLQSIQETLPPLYLSSIVMQKTCKKPKTQ